MEQMGRPPLGERRMTQAERSARRWDRKRQREEDMRGAIVDAAAVLMRAAETFARNSNVGLARECGIMAERILNAANDDPHAVIKLAIPGGNQGTYERERAERRSMVKHYLGDMQAIKSDEE
jgi:hypothetical protein